MVKKSKKKNSASLNIIAVLFAVVFIAYVFRYFMFKIETDMVRYDSMEDTIETQCVLIKNEWSTVLPGGTKADYKVNEGDRVGVGKAILKISENSGIDENILLKIDKINERIEEIKKTEEGNNFFAKDKEKIDASIQSNVKELKSVAASGDLSKLEAVKNELTANIYKKSLVYGSESFSGQNLEQLMKEKETLVHIQKNNLNMIYSRTSGLVSYELDGYEDVLKPENIKALKAAAIQQIIKNLTDKENKKKEDKIEGVKIVDNFEWFIAFVIPKGILTKDDLGKTIRVRFKEIDDTVVTGNLKYIDEGKEQSSLIVVRSDEQIKDLQRIRTAKVEIITKRGEGLIVPLKCIIERNGIKGIYIERSGMARFVPIKISMSEGEEVLVENLGKNDKGYNSKNYILKPYDRIITSVNKIKEDQMLPGAF